MALLTDSITLHWGIVLNYLLNHISCHLDHPSISINISLHDTQVMSLHSTLIELHQMPDESKTRTLFIICLFGKWCRGTPAYLTRPMKPYTPIEDILALLVMMNGLIPLNISPVNRWYGRQQRGRGLSCNTCPNFGSWQSWNHYSF